MRFLLILVAVTFSGATRKLDMRSRQGTFFRYFFHSRSQNVKTSICFTFELRSICVYATIYCVRGCVGPSVRPSRKYNNYGLKRPRTRIIQIKQGKTSFLHAAMHHCVTKGCVCPSVRPTMPKLHIRMRISQFKPICMSG